MGIGDRFYRRISSCLGFSIRGKGTAPKHMFLMLDFCSIGDRSYRRISSYIIYWIFHKGQRDRKHMFLLVLDFCIRGKGTAPIDVFLPILGFS